MSVDICDVTAVSVDICDVTAVSVDICDVTAVSVSSGDSSRLRLWEAIIPEEWLEHHGWLPGGNLPHRHHHLPLRLHQSPHLWHPARVPPPQNTPPPQVSTPCPCPVNTHPLRSVPHAPPVNPHPLRSVPHAPPVNPHPLW